MATNNELLREAAKITGALRSLGMVDQDTEVGIDFGSSTQGVSYRAVYVRTGLGEDGARHHRESSATPEWVAGYNGRIGRTRGEALHTLETARAALCAASRARTLTDS